MNNILKEELKRVKISDEEKEYLGQLANKVIEKLRAKIKSKGIDAQVFIGGSLAKDTIIRKRKYDIDLFVRFNKKYSEEEIQRYLKKIFRFFRIKGERIKKKKLKGSRNYYRILFKSNKRVAVEVVPSIKVASQEQARNITDLSYFHVNYIEKKFKKNKKLADEIILAKSFCHAQKCYGAESYIRGFSGYSLELLICHYKSFAKFLREILKAEGQIIIDSEKHYKNKKDVLESLNVSKTKSPIILVDPTFKERNAASALSKEVLSKFKRSARKFLENPSAEFFEYQIVNVAEMKEKAKEVRGIFAIFEIKTNKQPGDIAGTKLLKFSKVFTKEVGKNFEVILDNFEYGGVKKAWIFYVLNRKKEIIIDGPEIDRIEAVKKFKKVHPVWYIEERRIKSARATDLGAKEFLKIFKKKAKKTLKQMSIKKIKLV